MVRKFVVAIGAFPTLVSLSLALIPTTASAGGYGYNTGWHSNSNGSRSYDTRRTYTPGRR